MTNELDQLKNAWDTISETNSSKSLTSEELKKVVNKRSNNEISKIRRKIILECLISVLLSAGLVIYVHIIDPSKTWWVAIYISVIIVLGFFPYLKIVRFSIQGSGDLKQHLSAYVAAFDNLVRQYIKIYTFLIPIAMLLAYMLGFIIEVGVDNQIYEFRLMDLVIGVAIVGTVTFAGYLVLKSYFNWFYGKNMKRLKQCLAELSEVEE